MLKTLEKELNRLKRLEQEVEKTLKKAPEGRLRCASGRGYYQYYLETKYLNKKERELVRKLAQRDYCIALRKKLKKLIAGLEDILPFYRNEDLENVFRKTIPARQAVITPLVIPVEDIIREFESIQYEAKEFEKDDTTEFYTSKGERVRSKSEKIIADELYRYGIPYKYEMPIELNVWNKKVVFHPDFTVLNKRTGKKKILEHLGMMDKQGYYENAINKIDIYEKNGYILGDKLLIFHETATSPLNIKVMQNYIEHYLL